MKLVLPLLALMILLPACRTVQEVTHRGEVLTYAQYQSIKVEDQLTAKIILDRYGKPNSVHEENGRVRRLIYRCEDLAGKFRDLELVFDEQERLREKRL